MYICPHIAILEVNCCAGDRKMSKRPDNKKTVLDYALEYSQFGLCVIPVPYGTKAARIRWGKYQKCHPDEKQLRKWFANGNKTGGQQ